MTNRQPIKILPTMKAGKVEENDETSIAFYECQVTIMAIRDVETTYGKRPVASVKEKKKEFNVWLNNASITNLTKKYGSDDELWNGKICDLKLETDTTYNKDMIVFVPS